MGKRCLVNREDRRAALKRPIPKEVDILISAIAERATDMSKKTLKLIYLFEKEDKKAEAVEKFRDILRVLEKPDPNVGG